MNRASQSVQSSSRSSNSRTSTGVPGLAAKAAGRRTASELPDLKSLVVATAPRSRTYHAGIRARATILKARGCSARDRTCRLPRRWRRRPRRSYCCHLSYALSPDAARDRCGREPRRMEAGARVVPRAARAAGGCRDHGGHARGRTRLRYAMPRARLGSARRSGARTVRAAGGRHLHRDRRSRIPSCASSARIVRLPANGYIRCSSSIRRVVAKSVADGGCGTAWMLLRLIANTRAC